MNDQALIVVLVFASVTVTLRAMPFLAQRTLGESAFLRHLAKVMPVPVMALLVAYTLVEVPLSRPPFGLPEYGFAALAAVLYWRTRGLLLSIVVPLVGYVLVQSFALG